MHRAAAGRFFFFKAPGKQECVVVDYAVYSSLLCLPGSWVAFSSWNFAGLVFRGSQPTLRGSIKEGGGESERAKKKVSGLFCVCGKTVFGELCF